MTLYCLLHPTKLLHVSLEVLGVWPHSRYSTLTTGTSLPTLFQSHFLMVHIYSSPASLPFQSLEFSSYQLELSHCTKCSLLLLTCELCCPRCSEFLTISSQTCFPDVRKYLDQLTGTFFSVRSSTIVFNHVLFKQNPRLSELKGPWCSHHFIPSYYWWGNKSWKRMGLTQSHISENLWDLEGIRKTDWWGFSGEWWRAVRCVFFYGKESCSEVRQRTEWPLRSHPTREAQVFL